MISDTHVHDVHLQSKSKFTPGTKFFPKFPEIVYMYKEMIRPTQPPPHSRFVCCISKGVYAFANKRYNERVLLSADS